MKVKYNKIQSSILVLSPASSIPRLSSIQCFQAWTIIPIGVDGVQMYIIKIRTEMCS